MIKDARGLLKQDAIEKMKAQMAETKATSLLGFNEPDHKSLANMSVDQAIKLWPQLHVYAWLNVDGFLGKVTALYEKYGLPIWVTEDAVADCRLLASQRPRGIAGNRRKTSCEARWQGCGRCHMLSVLPGEPGPPRIRSCVRRRCITRTAA